MPLLSFLLFLLSHIFRDDLEEHRRPAFFFTLFRKFGKLHLAPLEPENGCSIERPIICDDLVDYHGLNSKAAAPPPAVQRGGRRAKPVRANR